MSFDTETGASAAGRAAAPPAPSTDGQRSPVFDYLVVTGSYWGFTLTDGAIRMLVVLYFHTLGYTPFEVAMLFVFYEAFGIVTNAVGGWLAARIGLNRTLQLGMAVQIGALAMLCAPDAWLGVPYVMAAQALSGIAKDLNKMSAKASVRTLAGAGERSRLFRWVALLTGSKNALKGAGFFAGAAGLEWLGFRATLLAMAAALGVVLVVTLVALHAPLGKAAGKVKFTTVFSNTPAINWLSAARLFLFGARDVWFVVGLPVFAHAVLGWRFMEVGAYLAAWIIGYGAVQAGAPWLLGSRRARAVGATPGGGAALAWSALLAAVTAGIAAALGAGLPPTPVVVFGLGAFGVVFALTSAVHSYLILAYAEHDRVAMNVGFYYMANAGGRLAGTVLSGWLYQGFGLAGCLWAAAGFVLASSLLCLGLPRAGRTGVHAGHSPGAA